MSDRWHEDLITRGLGYLDMKKIIMRVLPVELFYADHLTASAKRLFMRLSVALLGVVVAGVGIGILNENNWADVLSGAMFAWSTSFLVWAISSYGKGTDETSKVLRHMAELDLLHGRLNHIAHKIGAPMLDLQGEIGVVLEAREERLAHFTGLDEFRPDGPLTETEWWDPVALGIPSEHEDEK